MKIALLTPFYPYRGGIAQFSDRLYQELAKTDEVKVFSYSKLYPKILFPGKTQFVPDPSDNADLPSERILSSSGLCSHKTTAQSINKYKPDVLIIAYWMPYMALALSRVCSRLNKSIKVVSLTHNAVPHERAWLNKPLANRFFKQCHAFICMSPNVQADLLQMGIQQPILALEHPIYDHYPQKIDKSLAYSNLAINENKKTILFFGLIREYKGLDILIEAMGMLDNSYQLLIAGECYGSFSSYQQLIDLSKNRDNIKVWNQYIADNMVSTFFSAADVLALPYRHATQSGVVAIAYHMGTPMIATDVGSLGKTIRDSRTGLVVPNISAEALAQSIESFFETDYKTLYVDNLAKEKVRLSWSSFVTSIKPFILQLMT